MKHTFILSLAVAMLTYGAHGATSAIDWWMRPTICQVNKTNCYKTMGTGYNADAWDYSASCRGQKIICADALLDDSNGDTPMERADIARGDKIRSEFDINKLNGKCFGARKLTADGTMAAITGGKYTFMWCPGAVENIATTQIIDGKHIIVDERDQPTCSDLAYNGWVAQLNKKGKCYGVQYNPDDYHIDCGKTGLLPRRIVKLNGAYFMDKIDGGNFADKDKSDIEKTFDKMQAAAQERHAKYFK